MLHTLLSLATLQTPMPAPMESLAEHSPVEGWLRTGGVWLAVAVIALLANYLTKKIIVRGMRAFVARTKTTWDDVLVEHHVFERLSHLAPALVVYIAAPLLLNQPEDIVYRDYLRRFANVWMVVAGARTLHTLLDALVKIGQSNVASRHKPLRSYAQVVQLIIWVGAGILSVAVLMQKSPSALLAGLGAMTAILLLVFRDTILGFVASLQIEANQMVRIGDWIEFPKYGADGDVLEIGLNTVKIQNWDKTITTIPTYALMTDSFKNWRGMSESGGRRIKRALRLDMSSVHFLSDEDIERLRGISALRPYLEERTKAVEIWNKENDVDGTSPVNGRRLTNLGTFRAYIESYLRGLEPIREDMTFLVRQLTPTSQGVPMEIYCFSGEQRWVEYEAIMGDIFDHLLAVVQEFGLRVYQEPAGVDMRALASAQG